MFGDFSDQCGDILLDVLIRVLKTCQNSREDFCLNDHLSQVNRVFGDLTQGGENLALFSEKKNHQLVTLHYKYSKNNFLKWKNFQKCVNFVIALFINLVTKFQKNILTIHIMYCNFS